MSVTHEELKRFHQFAEKQLAIGGAELSWEELVEMWQAENSSTERSQEDLLAVRAALRDLDNGDRGIPMDDHLRELHEKYGLAEE